MAHCWPYQHCPSHQILHSADPLADNPPTCAATPLEMAPSLLVGSHGAAASQTLPQEEPTPACNSHFYICTILNFPPPQVIHQEVLRSAGAAYLAPQVSACLPGREGMTRCLHDDLPVAMGSPQGWAKACMHSKLVHGPRARPLPPSEHGGGSRADQEISRGAYIQDKGRWKRRRACYTTSDMFT
jgi:hypothetical protein